MAKRWPVAIAGMAVLSCAGAIYIWGVFQKPVAELFGWTQAASAATFAFTLGVFALGSIFGGRVVDKVGPREITMIGGAMIGAGVFLTSYSTAENPWIMYSTYGILMGFGVGTVYTPVLSCVLKWFPDKSGTMTGAVVTFMGVSGVVFSPVAKMLIGSHGVLPTFKILGIIFGLMIVIAAMFLKNPPPGYKPEGWNPPTPAANAAMARDYGPAEIIKKYQFYCLAMIMLVGCMSGLMVIPFAATLATQAGLSPTTATAAVMLIALLNALGRLFWGSIADKIGRVKALKCILAVSGVCMLFLNSLPGATTLIGLGIVGLCYGGFLGCMPATVREFFGTKNAGTNYGIVLLFFGVAAISAPIASGMILDITGTFSGAFYICVAATVIGLFFAFTCKPIVEKE